MSETNVGILEQLSIKVAWPKEDSDFTPGLAEHISQLGDAIGMDLEEVGTEKPVGSFSADILARNVGNNEMVVIENQIGQTDHDHIGKALTYAAGLGAKTVVWVSERFRDEHLAVLEWLNDIVDGRVVFFGVEVQLWRIGESPPAARFEVVKRPNKWAVTIKKTVQQAGLTKGQKVQLEFWEAYATFMEGQDVQFRMSSPLPQNWFLHTIGESNVYLSAVASRRNSETNKHDGGELRAELVVNVPESKQIVAHLELEKDTIHNELEEVLIWHNPEDSVMSRLYLRQSVNISDRADWDNQHRWLKTKLESMCSALKPRVAEARKKIRDENG